MNLMTGTTPGIGTSLVKSFSHGPVRVRQTVGWTRPIKTLYVTPRRQVIGHYHPWVNARRGVVGMAPTVKKFGFPLWMICPQRLSRQEYMTLGGANLTRKTQHSNCMETQPFLRKALTSRAV